jgi:hypothetical protein
MLVLYPVCRIQKSCCARNEIRGFRRRSFPSVCINLRSSYDNGVLCSWVGLVGFSCPLEHDVLQKMQQVCPTDLVSDTWPCTDFEPRIKPTEAPAFCVTLQSGGGRLGAVIVWHVKIAAGVYKGPTFLRKRLYGPENDWEQSAEAVKEEIAVTDHWKYYVMRNFRFFFRFI